MIDKKIKIVAPDAQNREIMNTCKKLWENNFDDTAKYVKYYFDDRWKESITFLCDDKSMLHLNPYDIKLFGEKKTIFYIVGVCTDKEYRHKGYMDFMLKTVFGKLYNENVITNEQGELFLAEKTFSVMSLFEQKEMMRRMLFEISGHRKDISLVHVEQMLALMANKEGKQQNCPYGVLAKRVRDGLLLMKLSTDVTFSDKNKQKDGQQKSDEQNLENLNKKNKKCGNHSEDKMQPVYLQLTAESEESKAEETIVLSNETLLQKFTIHFSILPWNGGKVAKRDCVKYFDYDKMKCKPCLRTRDTGDYFIMDKEGRRKSLGRYFIDTKIPASDRDGQLLLADGSHIMWIIGGRISEFYKVSSETKRVLRVSVQEKEEN